MPNKSQKRPRKKKEKENTPANTAGKGLGGRSGNNRRTNGDSDDEIAKLNNAQMDGAMLKSVKKQEATSEAGSLTNTDKLTVVRYITSLEVWKTFKLKQAIIWIHVSTIHSVC